MNLKSLVNLVLALMFILAATLPVGCGKETPTEKSSNTPAVASQTIVSKWKTEDPNTKAPMGLVLEQAGTQISATLYELKSTTGFDLGRKLAIGKYVPDQKSVILIMPNLPPTLMPLDQWLANGGPHVKIPFTSGATNLTMTTVLKNGPVVSANLVPFVAQ